MRIAIDAMGGDFAPEAPIRACAELLADGGDLFPVLVGNRGEIERCARDARLPLDGIEIVHAENTIGMNDAPLSVRTLSDTSLRVGATMLAEGRVDAFVSAGNTGALQTAATLFVKRCRGVRRAAIGTVLPMETPVLLIDSGANTTYTPEFLHEFAVMGSIYMNRVCGVKNPRVGLLNNGAEKGKGREGYPEAYALLAADDGITFVGNVEACDLPYGVCDVLTADGFSGNVLLKTIEGLSSYLLREVSRRDKAAADAVKQRFDPARHGGSLLLGISAPVVKAHGSSGAHAVANAARKAALCAQSGVCSEIGSEIQKRNDSRDAFSPAGKEET